MAGRILCCRIWECTDSDVGDVSNLDIRANCHKNGIVSRESQEIRGTDMVVHLLFIHVDPRNGELALCHQVHLSNYMSVSLEQLEILDEPARALGHIPNQAARGRVEILPPDQPRILVSPDHRGKRGEKAQRLLPLHGAPHCNSGSYVVCIRLQCP